MSRKQLIAAGAIVVAIGAMTIALLIFRDDGKRETKVPPRREPQSMEGMAGMEMPDSGAVTLTHAQIQQFGVTFAVAERRMLTDQVRATGVVAFDEARLAVVAAKFGGVAERLYANTTGAHISRGAAVLEAYSPELISAQEELLVAARLGAQGSDLLEAAKARLRLLDVSSSQIEEVLSSGRSRRTLTLRSPAGGVIVEKNIVAGQAFQAGETLLRIADLSTVWIETELRETEAALVRPGNPAEIELPALQGRSIAGTVEYVYPTVRPETRTLKVRIRIANPGNALKPGMYATTRLRIPARTTLTVPVSALVRTGERNVVFVDLGNGHIMAQDVGVGATTTEYVEILSGLQAGQRVVTSAQFLIDSESNLSEVMRSMIGQMNTSDVRGR